MRSCWTRGASTHHRCHHHVCLAHRPVDGRAARLYLRPLYGTGQKPRPEPLPAVRIGTLRGPADPSIKPPASRAKDRSMVQQSDPRTPRRASRTTDADDPFTERMLVASEWARRNATVLIVSIVAVVVVVGGFLYYRSYQADRHERASAEFMQLQAAVDAGQAEAVRTELESFVNRFEGTDYALEGRVALAEVHLQEDNPQAALDILDGHTGRVGRSPLNARAAMLAAAAHEELDRPDEAVRLYRRVGSDAELSFLRRQALLAAGALLEERSDFGGAVDVYRQALDNIAEDSPERPRFEMRLAEAEARARHNG